MDLTRQVARHSMAIASLEGRMEKMIEIINLMAKDLESKEALILSLQLEQLSTIDIGDEDDYKL